MSVRGQLRRSRGARTTSGLTQSADMLKDSRHVSNVPVTETQ